MTQSLPDTRPFANFEWKLALRYLRARRKEGIVSVISLFSFLGIMLGVATLIVVMSVFNGFHKELLDKVLGFSGHATIYDPQFEPVQDVREETLWGGISTIHLTLMPKGNAGYKYAEIWVDSAGMPVQTKIVEKNGDATTMRLSGMERNAKMSSDEFNLKLDSNVKIIKG